MADSASIGAGNSSYQGNAGLGGGTFGAVNLDFRPVEDLGRYIMLYNKAEYEQRQKDYEKAAAEIADMTSYDLTTGIPKDAKHLQEKYDRLTTYVNENPGALDYRNKKAWAEYKKLRNDMENDLRGGKVRNTMYAVRQKEIQDEVDPEKRKLMQKELDDEIAATDIRTPIKHSQQYADPTIKLPTAPELTFDVMKVGPNQIVERDFSVFNVPKARANGDVFSLGLDNIAMQDPNTPEGARQQIARKNNFWVQGADAYNAVINARDANGQFLYKKEVKDSDGNITYELDESKLSKMPRSLVNLAKQTNDYLTEFKADIKAGVYKDKFEKPLTFGQGGLDENDYAPINYEDGISPEELALVAQYAQWKGDTYSTKATPTDNAIQMANLAETRRHNKATEGIAWENLKLEKDQWTSTMKGGEEVKNGALEFARRIYSDMEKLADKDGIITPDKIRQLNQEQLKYLGIEKLETNATTGQSKSIFSPMSIDDNSLIQLINGEIKVLSGANKQGTTWYGEWDNTRSTNIFNVATNRLNEQLKTAGAKELNSYLPIDLGTGGVSTNTIQPTIIQSGGSTKTETDAEYYKRTGQFRKNK